MVSYRNHESHTPRGRQCCVATLPLTPYALLLAFVACWRMCRRAPTEAELLGIGITPSMHQAQTNELLSRGLLAARYANGVRVRGTTAPTTAALRQVDELLLEAKLERESVGENEGTNHAA